MVMKTPDRLFLEEPTWVALPGGRVRCVQTGHEMSVEAQATYSQTKKCRAALFDAALKKRISPLNFFEQCSDKKDKIVCKLTGVVLNKKEDAVWKHMTGKKFEAKLVEIEADKESPRGDVEMTENSGAEMPKKKKSLGKKGKVLENSEMMENGTQERSSNKAGKNKQSKCNKSRDGEESDLGFKSLHDENEAEDGEEAGSSESSDFWVPSGGEEAGSSESSDFWMPPPGDRWDFDDGNDDRWSHPAEPEGADKRAEGEPGDDTEVADLAVELGEDDVDNGSSDVEVKIRTKRTASGSSKQTKKRKAKRPRNSLSLGNH